MMYVLWWVFHEKLNVIFIPFREFNLILHDTFFLEYTESFLIFRAAAAVSRAMQLSIGITPDVKGELGARSFEENGANISSSGPESEMEKTNESGLSKLSQNSEKSGNILEERSSKSDSR